MYIRLGTFKSRLARARKKLMEALTEFVQIDPTLNRSQSLMEE
jgi:DNA-directed RNA polymerase specialized sigma24 family protein